MNLKFARLLLISLLLIFMVAAVSQAKQKSKDSGDASTVAVEAVQDDSQSATHTVVVYYLHMEPRCTSCKKIEAFTNEAIEAEFEEELEDGILVWMPIDVKAEGNWHYVEDFQLRSKSVVVADYEGEEDKKKLLSWKNLEEVWPLLRDKPEFLKYIQKEARIYLDQEYQVEDDDDKKKD